MSVDVKRNGHYEVFETNHHHKILVLDDSDYYAWIDTSQGHILVKSDSEHKKEKTLNKGEYLILLPKNDPNMKDDVDHLELQEGDRFHTYMLPNGLPTEKDEQKKIVHTDDYLSKEKVHKLAGQAH